MRCCMECVEACCPLYDLFSLIPAVTVMYFPSFITQHHFTIQKGHIGTEYSRAGGWGKGVQSGGVGASNRRDQRIGIGRSDRLFYYYYYYYYTKFENIMHFSCGVVNKCSTRMLSGWVVSVNSPQNLSLAHLSHFQEGPSSAGLWPLGAEWCAGNYTYYCVPGTGFKACIYDDTDAGGGADLDTLYFNLLAPELFF